MILGMNRGFVLENSNGWSKWEKHVLFQLEEIYKWMGEHCKEHELFKDKLFDEIISIKEMVDNKLSKQIEEQNKFYLSQKTAMVAMRTKLGIYSAIISGGFILFFSVILPMIINLVKNP